MPDIHISSKRLLTIPAKIARQVSIDGETLVNIRVVDGEIRIRKIQEDRSKEILGKVTSVWNNISDTPKFTGVGE